MKEMGKDGIAGRDLLLGKTVAVTGSSRGIGRAIILAAAAQGAIGLCVHYLGDAETEDEAKSLQKEIYSINHQVKVVLVGGDISKQETGQKIVEQSLACFRRLDIYVSNAGICQFSSFLDITPELWHKTQDINLNGAFYGLHAAASAMSKQERHPSSSDGLRGNLIAISSISALVGGGEQPHYTPTKAGIKSLIESMSISLGPLGIRCNCVLPGTIATAINQDDLMNNSKREYMEKRTPLGRLGNPGDVAGAFLFLASDLSRYMQGSSVLVDGGILVNLQ